MLKLLKYELKKRKKSLIIGAIALAAMEGLALYFLNKQESYIILAIVLMSLMISGVVLAVFLDVAIHYYNDFKKAQGTLLFLTSNKGHKVIGSKMIFGAVELLLGLGLAGLFTYITNSVAVNLGYAGIGPAINELKQLLILVVGSENTWWVFIGFFFLVFLQYLTGQSVAISSITLGRTIFSRNNYNWLLAVGLFIGVTIAIQSANGAFLLFMGMGDGIFETIQTTSEVTSSIAVDVARSLGKYLIAAGVLYTFWIAASFVVSSLLINKKIDI